MKNIKNIIIVVIIITEGIPWISKALSWCKAI